MGNVGSQSKSACTHNSLSSAISTSLNNCLRKFYPITIDNYHIDNGYTKNGRIPMKCSLSENNCTNTWIFASSIGNLCPKLGMGNLPFQKKMNENEKMNWNEKKILYFNLRASVDKILSNFNEQRLP